MSDGQAVLWVICAYSKDVQENMQQVLKKQKTNLMDKVVSCRQKWHNQSLWKKMQSEESFFVFSPILQIRISLIR